MEDQIRNRVISASNYFIENEVTVRKVANIYKVSKSTIHRDFRYRLPRINGELYKKVAAMLESNKAERYKRGGEATKCKYLRR